MRTRIVSSFLTASILATAVAQPVLAQNEGTGHCHYKQTTTTTTTYSTSAIKVVYTVFGLFGSTQKCKTKNKTTTSYTYCGPPLKKVVVRPIGHGPEESTAGWGFHELGDPLSATWNGLTVGPGTTTTTYTTYELRLLDGEAPCYGDLVVPDLDSTTGRVRYIGLDGIVRDLAFTPATGTLAWFLGAGYDASAFDPAYLNSAGWTGHVATIQQSDLVQPTLTYLAGGNPGVPVTAMVDLDNPDLKVLHVDLGSANAGTQLYVVVSATPPGDAPLLVVDGITVPIVPDAYTNAFATVYPNVGGTADANGRADIAFPLLSMPSLEGVDLHVAVLALDPVTGLARDASTFVTMLLRDLDVCQ